MYYHGALRKTEFSSSLLCSERKRWLLSLDLDLLNPRQGVEYKIVVMGMGSEQYWGEQPIHHQAHYSHCPSDALSAL